MIDMASVYAERYRKTPDVLRAAVVGQSPDSRLDPYTALNALKLVNESNRMMMASQAQQPTSSPSLVAQNMAPPPMQQGLGAMVPGTMDQAPQGMPPQQAPMPQPTMQAASGGLAGMYSPEEDFAEGGIVAFAAPTPENNYSLVRDPEAPAVSANPFESYAPAVSADPFARSTEGDGEEDDYLTRLDEIEAGEGSPAGFAAANKLAMAAARRIASRSARDLTPEEAKTLYATEYEKITKAAGPSPYAGLRADLTAQGKERAGNLNIAQGEALLEAASAVLEGSNAVRGLAQGGAKFAKSYGAAQRADQAAKRSMANMEFAISDAERKERSGNSRAATAAVENRRKAIADYNKTELERDKALGRLATDMGRFNRPAAKAAGSGDASTKLPQVDREAALITKQIIALEAKDPSDPQIAILKKQREGLIEILGMGKEGPTAAPRAAAALTAKQNESVAKSMAVWEGGMEKRKAVIDGTIDAVRAAKKEAFRQDALRGVFDTDGEETPSVITPKPKNTGKIPPPAGFKPDNG
jgi:hypothetical protein